MDFLDFSLDTVSKQQKTRQNFTGIDFLDFSLDTVSKQQKTRQNFTGIDFLDFSLDTVSKQKTRQNFTGMDFLDFRLDTVSIQTILETQHDKTNKMNCAPSEYSDQHGHPPSLIRVFSVRMKKPWVLSYPLSAQWRLWSEWAGMMPRLIWVFAGCTGHFAGFVMLWLLLIKHKISEKWARVQHNMQNGVELIRRVSGNN